MRAAASSTASGRLSRRAAELGDLVVGLELRPRAEERDRLGLGERRHRVLDLALDAQQLAARDEQREVRAGARERGELRRRVDHLLEVVERASSSSRSPMCSARPFLAPSACAIVSGDERGIAQRRERDPEDAAP